MAGLLAGCSVGFGDDVTDRPTEEEEERVYFALR
jgi:hypothetical protein